MSNLVLLFPAMVGGGIYWVCLEMEANWLESLKLVSIITKDDKITLTLMNKCNNSLSSIAEAIANKGF